MQGTQTDEGSSVSRGTKLTAHEIDTIRGLLIDGNTIPEVVRLTTFSRSSVNAQAQKMLAEGLPVAECTRGRRRKPKVTA